MNLSCYIIDDEHHSIEVLDRYINKTPELVLAGKNIDPIIALDEICSKNPPDLVFLDVDMPQLNGLEVAELIKPVTTIVFTTSYREYGPEAFEKNAADYLLKPINYERFLKCIIKVRRHIAIAANSTCVHHSSFYVKSNVKGKFIQIEIANIRYIENIGNYISIYTTNQKIITYLTLNEVLSKLPERSFSRIHQSYIINHAFIRDLEYAQVRLHGDISIPVGGTYRAGFRQKIQASILISKRDAHST